MIDITEVNAVNMMLQSVGEQSVTTLAGTLPSDVSSARTILSEMDAEFQMMGWSFNRRIKVELAQSGETPNVTYLPYTSTDGDQVKPVPLMVVPRTRSKKYGMRRKTTGTPKKWYLYDINEDSDDLGGTVTVDMIIGLDFEELPHSARNYIARSASRVYAERVFGEPNQALRFDESRAYAAWNQHESESYDYPMTDTFSVYRAAGRPSPIDNYNS